MLYKNPIPTVVFDDDEERIEIKPDINDYVENKSVFFAYLDVLGFKQAFYENKIKADSLFAKKFKDVFTHYFDLMESALFMKKGLLSYAGQTSDTLYFYTDRPDYLVEFLKIFSYLNVYAMTQDVFFRGGVSQGNLSYKSSYQFYGDCVINAYLLESEISKNPIIVIDENTYSAIKEDPETSSLVITEKSRHYINPFAYLQNKNFILDVDQDKIRNIDSKALEDIIMSNKSKFEYDSKNFEKYVFLFDKLNNKDKKN